jgi:peptide/nickel transport system substrate-binding protein
MMAQCIERFATAVCLLLDWSFVSYAQKPGGIPRVWLLDSPASMSIHEEATVVAERPVMGVFNNLVLFDQHVKQNSPGSILPEPANGPGRGARTARN